MKNGEHVPWNPEAFDKERINRDIEEIHWCYQNRLEEGAIEYELTGLRVPDEYKEMVRELFEATDQFAARHLGGDPEYVRLFHRAAVKLARKRPSPLKRGQFKNWVGGIIYGLGSVNYLFDPDETPHLPGQKIGKLLDIPDSTLKNKANRVKDELDIEQFDTEWIKKDLLLKIPFFWEVNINGDLVDARRLERAEFNELRERGVIPDVERSDFPRGDVI